jgi:hypothetical protein
VKRRDFITLLGGAYLAWPLAARAQQPAMPTVGWLDNYDEAAAESQAIKTALREALAKVGWIDGRNLKIDRRFGSDANRLRAVAAELVSLAPAVILAGGAAPTRALQQVTQTIPIVFSGGGRPSRQWPCKEYCPARGQYHRVQQRRTNRRGQVAGAPQRGSPCGHQGRDSVQP